MSQTRDASAFPDAEAAMVSAMRRLPADPLVVAQAAEAYLVGGLAAGDAGRLREALRLSQLSIEMDPQNGYRWETKGTALAALGDSSGAIESLLTTVRYAPADRQAWVTLSQVYRRLGDTVGAAAAEAHAASLSPPSGETR
jgi:Flp pilus assembly protein TadD